MGLKDSGSCREARQSYSEPKLVEHGDIAEITKHLFGGDDDWDENCKS